MPFPGLSSDSSTPWPAHNNVHNNTPQRAQSHHTISFHAHSQITVSLPTRYLRHKPTDIPSTPIHDLGIPDTETSLPTLGSWLLARALELDPTPHNSTLRQTATIFKSLSHVIHRFYSTTRRLPVYSSITIRACTRSLSTFLLQIYPASLVLVTAGRLNSNDNRVASWAGRGGAGRASGASGAGGQYRLFTRITPLGYGHGHDHGHGYGHVYGYADDKISQ
jgi:hypothetical protein